LGVSTTDWKAPSLRAFGDLSLVLDLISDLHRWSTSEKQDAVRIIRAKASADEAEYLRLSQKHRRLRAELIKLGSVPQPKG
jgi:hypothetical protein